jgi:hypothetical protein
MLRSVKLIEKCKINATDGEIGHIKDLYFDDETWVIRYLVVNAGSWLAGRDVLISPISVKHPDWEARQLPLTITKEQVSSSPGFDADQPVTRQNEMQYSSYYGFPYYWAGAGIWGGGMYPNSWVSGFPVDGMDRSDPNREREANLLADRVRHRNDDPHLRSCHAVVGYHIQATDGEIGKIAGYLVDEQNWAVRYVVVDTSRWWAGHQVLIAPDWISGVHWLDRTVSVDMSRESVKLAPPYNPDMPWSPKLELSLFQHYGRSGYWAGSAAAEARI